MSKGPRSVSVLAAVYFRRCPGVVKLGEAFRTLYSKYLDKVAPGTELDAGQKHFKQKTTAA